MDMIAYAAAKKYVDDTIKGVGSLKGEKGDPGPQGPQGPAGPAGSDASVTKENITAALNYTPVDPETIYTKEEIDEKIEENGTWEAMPDKPFGQQLIEGEILLEETIEEITIGTRYFLQNKWTPKIRIYLDDVAYNFLTWEFYDDGSYRSYYSQDIYVSQHVTDNTIILYLPNGTYKIKACYLEEEIKQLDEQYIPDTIIVIKVTGNDDGTEITIDEDNMLLFKDNENSGKPMYMYVENQNVWLPYIGQGMFVMELGNHVSGIAYDQETQSFISINYDTERVQSDWQQSDNTQSDYIRNKPFGEIWYNDHYNQSENPSPISFNMITGEDENGEKGYTFYKIFNLIPTRDQIVNGLQFDVNGVYESINENNLLVDQSNIIGIQTDNGYGYLIASMIGEIQIEDVNGITGTINIPEGGTYFARPLGYPILEGTEVGIQYSDIQKIDSRFLPEISSSVNTFELLPEDFTNETDPDKIVDTSISNTKANVLYEKIMNEEIFILRIKATSEQSTFINVQHSGGGAFYTIVEGFIISFIYYHNGDIKGFKTRIMPMTDSTATASYNLDPSTNPTLFEILEMISQSMQERGLVKTQ